jgi:hypothetical protein
MTMTSRDFCYWLQGYFELHQTDAKTPLTGAQADLIKRHLALVFKHEIDPSAGSAAHQAELSAIHNPHLSAPAGADYWPGGVHPHGLTLKC